LRATPPVDAHALDELLRRRIQGVRQVSEIAISDSGGRILYSSKEGPPSELPPAARALVEDQARHPEAGLQISEPFRGSNGQWTALMIRRISSQDGRVDGAAIGYLNLKYFEEFYKAVELTENGAILLHLRDGTVLARYPHNDAAVGQTYADLPPFKDILAHDIAGTTIMDSPIDGTRRVLAIRALKAFPLAVNISVAEGMVLESWRRQTWIFSAVAVGACASRYCCCSHSARGKSRRWCGSIMPPRKTPNRRVVRYANKWPSVSGRRQHCGRPSVSRRWAS
jgi:hypothetical protein